MAKKDYSYRSLRDERRYGFYWYSGLWAVLRPVALTLAVVLIVAGIVVSARNKLYEEFAAPVDEANPVEIAFQVENGQSLSRVAANL